MKDNATPQPDVVEDARAYSFGPFRLEVDQAALLRDGASLSLRPKSFDVLHYLVRHPQRLVSREELLRAVWPGVVVTDDSLTQCLIEIRKVLDDRQKSIVRTVPRRGYLLDVPVQVETAGRPSVATQGEAPAARLPSRWTLLALLVLAVAVGVTWWRSAAPPEGNPVTPSDREPPAASIAVLPFTDMSPEGDQGYLGDGIAEEILNLLAQVRGLTVIARTSSFSFKGQQTDIGTIARRLNVAYVLEGSVRKAGDRVRVTAQLVSGADGLHLWSQTFEEHLQDVFALQDEIARNVTEVLKDRLLGDRGGALALSGRASHVPDPRAWELYLRGRHLYGRRMTGDRIQAQSYFEQALEIDPDLSAAWVSLAATYSTRAGDPDVAEHERLTFDEALPLAREALTKALALDPDNPEALLRMGRFNWFEGHFDQALEQFERAMRSGRNNALVQSMLGGLAVMIGDPAVGAELQARAATLDPISSVHLFNLAHYSYMAGRLEEARSAMQAAEHLNPENNRLNQEMYFDIAMLNSDLAAAQELASGLPPGPAFDRARALLAFRQGKLAASDAALERLRRSGDPATPLHLAEVHAFRGEADAAFAALDAALAYLSGLPSTVDARHAAVALRSSLFLRPLHGDRRWPAWVDQVRQQFSNPLDERLMEVLRDYAGQPARN